MARIWQKIEGRGQICHWWQQNDGRRITAMTEMPFTEMLSAATAVLALVVGFAVLVLYVRNDTFAGPGTAHRPSDELGPFAARRRQA